MDDNFSSIVATVAEGRQLFQNLRMSFAFLLMIHIPLVATAAIVPLLGYPLLYLPVHIVWLELLIHPAAILGFQNTARGVLERQKTGSLAFFEAREWVTVMLTGLGIAAGVLAVFIVAMKAGNAAEHARSMAILTLVAALATLLIVLSRGTTRAARIVACCALASGLAISLIDDLSLLLHLQGLSFRHTLTAVASGAVPALAGAMISYRRHQ